MFQINKRSISLTQNDEAREVLNERLREVQEVHGIEFTSINECFSQLLALAGKAASSQPEIKEVVKAPAFSYVLAASSQEHEAFEKELHAVAACSISAGDGYTNEDIIKHCVSNHLGQLNLIDSLKATKPETITETVTEFKEKELASNEFIVQMDDKQQILLQAIAARRQKKFKKNTPETYSELGKKMIFNDGTVFDLAGEFFTGLNGFLKR